MTPLRDRATLLGYRLRPLDARTLLPAVLVALAVGVLTIPGGPPPPPFVPTVLSVTTPLIVIAAALAATLAFVSGRDVDPAEPLLSSLPVPFRRTLVVRVGLWAAVLSAVIAVLGGRAAGVLEAPPGPLRSHALVHLVFAGSVTLVLARAFGPLAGGGAALAVLALVAGVPLVYQGFPVDLLAEAGSDEAATTAARLAIASAVLLGGSFRRMRP